MRRHDDDRGREGLSLRLGPTEPEHEYPPQFAWLIGYQDRLLGLPTQKLRRAQRSF